jgi:hypothetical protein
MPRCDESGLDGGAAPAALDGSGAGGAAQLGATGGAAFRPELAAPSPGVAAGSAGAPDAAALPSRSSPPMRTGLDGAPGEDSRPVRGELGDDLFGAGTGGFGTDADGLGTGVPGRGAASGDAKPAHFLAALCGGGSDVSITKPVVGHTIAAASCWLPQWMQRTEPKPVRSAIPRPGAPPKSSECAPAIPFSIGPDLLPVPARIGATSRPRRPVGFPGDNAPGRPGGNAGDRPLRQPVPRYPTPEGAPLAPGHSAASHRYH